MPSREYNRKRALAQDADSSRRNDELRSLLSHPRLNVKNLNGIVRVLERQPDLLSANQDELSNVSAGYFESVRQSKQVLRRDGTFFEWVFADPNLLLQRTLRECPNLAELYAQKLRERPCDVNNPWSLIVVFDAFTPASLSCPRPANVKTMNLAFNFLELGSSALCVDATWLLPVSVRNEMVEEAVGGWSACLAIYLRAHLLGDFSIQSVGVPFTFGGTWYTIFAALRLLSSDGEGLKFALDLKGYNGIIPCISCANVLKKDSGLAHRRPNFVEITCWDHSKFIPTARRDFEDHVDEIVGKCALARCMLPD